MQRETQEFTTKGSHQIVFKTYVTGREMNEIQKVLLKDIKMDVLGGKESVNGFNVSNITELNNKTIEVMVISIDGKTDGVLDTILDLPNDDYKEVVAKLEEVTQGKKKE